MAIFPQADIEATIQTNDKTRIDATKTFVSKDEAAITMVEIEPEAAAGFIDVTGTKIKDRFLDWLYVGTTRTVTISVRVTTDGAPVVSTFTMEVITSADDKLFSNDQDLVSKEHDILKRVSDGRNSYLNLHRRAQEMILADLDEQGITDTSGNRLTKDAVVDFDEFREWSADLVMSLIYQDFSNALDDVYAEKSRFYNSLALKHRKRSFLRVDLDGDGEIDDGENVKMTSMRISRA